MKHSILIFSPVTATIAIINILINRDHLLLSLLSLEVIILGLLLVLVTSGLVMSSIEIVCLLVLLTIGACEARLGLACLVLITRSQGNDHLTSLTRSKF